MPVKFNPFTGQLQIDEKGSGGGSSYIDGEVVNFAALPLDSSAPLDSAWLVRTATNSWFGGGNKPAGIYIRTSTAGSSRDTDWTYAGTMPDVFSDANFTIYDEADTSKNLKFQLSGISTGTTRTLTIPNANVTLPNQGTSTTDSPTFNKLTLTPDSNDSSLKLGTLEFQSYTTNNAWIGDNVYLDGTTFRRRSAGAATLFYFQGDEGQFRCDVSNSAGTSVTNAPTFKVGTGGQFSAGANVSNEGEFDASMLHCDGSNIGLSDLSDPTKKAKLDLSGITANQTRVLSLPDASGVIALQGQIATSGLTQATNRILGRTTASSGAIQELTVGSGLTLASGSLAATSIPAKTDVFTSSGTWTKPAGAKLVHYVLVGGGGGGGGGRRSNSTTAAYGGGGGAGGGVSVGWLNADFLGATETVTIGAGGSGGSARTAADTNGADGVAGNTTSFTAYLEARGGAQGSGGTTTTGTRGAATAARGAFYGGTQDAMAGGGAGSPETTGGTGENRMSMPSGGGGGAGKSAAGAYGTGGASAAIGLAGTGSRTGISATANAAGTNGTGFFYYGLGGSGGSPNSTTGAANKGGDGGSYGAGGGGGAGSLNAAGGDNSGGAGANGVVVITTYF